MRDVYPKRRFAVFLALTLATASMTSLTVAIKPQQAIAQSPMEMMEMMMGDGNMTNGSMMMDNNNMSMPFNMGVLVLPTMCTTPNQLLGSLTGMFGSEGIMVPMVMRPNR